MDKFFLILVMSLVLGGFFIFISASMGLLVKDGASFGSVAGNQALLGLLGGLISMVVLSKINYRDWKKYSFYLFIVSVILTALVFIPQIGLEHNGAKRWILLGSFSFQPSELLKLGSVLYAAAFFAGIKDRITSIRWGLLPLLGILTTVGIVILKQPDTGTFFVIFIAIMSMFLIAGGKWRHILAIVVISVIGFVFLVYQKPYLAERIEVFINPYSDPTGSGWQIRQALISIGSGGIFGKGFGQSIQKFSFLPEPIGDSVFAVAAEEFGFVGGLTIIIAFFLFLWRGFHIAKNVPDKFGGLLTLGIVIIIAFQSFINIASMLGVFPLTGVPLFFISHGGTAMFFALSGVGIVLNISRYCKLS